MVKEEWKQCIAILKSFYTSDKFLPDTMSWQVWFEGLKDIPFEIMSASIIAYSQTNRFAPTVADLREQAMNLMNKDTATDMEAWATVSMAIRNSTHHAEEEFQKLPSMLQKCVGSPGVLREWAMMEQEKIAVAQAQFLKSYRATETRERNINLLSPDVKKAFCLEATKDTKPCIEVKTETVKREEFFTPSESYLAEIRKRLGGL